MSISCEVVPGWMMSASLWMGVFFLVLSLDVMQRTQHDEINKRDSWWVQLIRRFGFIVMASVLGWMMFYAWTAQTEMYTVFLFLTFASGGFSLAVNDLALRLRRSSPNHGPTVRSEIERYSSRFIAATLQELQEELKRLDRGQLLTHEQIAQLDRGQLLTHMYLNQILSFLELKPDPAVIREISKLPSVIFPPQWKRS